MFACACVYVCGRGVAETVTSRGQAATPIWRLDIDEIMESGSKPQEEERLPRVMQLSAGGRTSFPPSPEASPVTFTTLTAADQNNTYLFMRPSRNHMWAKQAYSRKSRQTSACHGDIDFLGREHSSESCNAVTE